MKRFAAIFALFLCVCLPLAAQPKYEVRAVWLTTIGGIDWPHSYARTAQGVERQKQELRDILDRLQRANINTVLLQTRIRGTVIYPSALEPWDGCLSGNPGQSPGYDALAFAIDECHRRGMELHAWVVTIPVGKWQGTGCSRLRRRLPKLISKIGADGYMNPERRETADYLADLCEEIVSGYDVDGIHLDYIRYPETWPVKVSRAVGREYITRIVRTVSQRVKQRKPWVKMSCSPVGKHDDLPRYSSRGWNARQAVCQDAQAWLREGLMDELFPMMYFRGDNFYPFAFDWQEQSAGRIVVPGLGIYFMSPREKNWPLTDITREMEVLRSSGMGQAYFRSKFLTDDTKGIYRFATTQFYRYPALVPPMTWASTKAVGAPTELRRSADGASMLSWTPAGGTVGDGQIYYNVYASRRWPVDTEDARCLLLPRTARTSIPLPADRELYYAVTATDRYGTESAACQEQGPVGDVAQQASAPAFLPCDGQRLTLPDKPSTLDADYATIETLQGTVVRVVSYSGSPVDVSRLEEGIYIVRSLGKKGRTHRLGHFEVRRSF